MISEDRFICFGGNHHLDLLNDTLVGTIPQSDTQITQISLETLESPGQSPSHRRGHAAVTLGETKKVFLHGGNTQESCTNDSYIFDGETGKWRCIHPTVNPFLPGAHLDTSRPPPRTNHALVALAPGGSNNALSSSQLMGSTIGLSGFSGFGGGEPSCVLLYGGQWTRMRGGGPSSKGKGVAVQPPMIYSDSWLFDLKSEKWHHVRLRECMEAAGGQGPSALEGLQGAAWCQGPGKRMGHTLTGVGGQSSTCLLWGGGPDVSQMLVCNDGYLIDLRMNGVIPASTVREYTIKNGVFNETDRILSGYGQEDDSDLEAEDWESNPFLLQPGNVPRRSIAPRMFHTFDHIGDNVYLIFGGYAGHRTCGGLWKATLMNSDADKRQKCRQRGIVTPKVNGGDGQRGKEQSKQNLGMVPEAPDPCVEYHHLPFMSSPFQPANPNRVPINEVLMFKGSGDRSDGGGDVIVMEPVQQHFPSAFERDVLTTGTLPRHFSLAGARGGGNSGSDKGPQSQAPLMSQQSLSSISQTSQQTPPQSPNQSQSAASLPKGAHPPTTAPEFKSNNLQLKPGQIDPTRITSFELKVSAVPATASGALGAGAAKGKEGSLDGSDKSAGKTNQLKPNLELLDAFIEYGMQGRILFAPTVAQIESLCRLVLPILQTEPSLLSVNPPVKVYGDVHGNFAALIRFFYEFGSPLTRPELGFLFLGDYVDRGKQSVACVALLFALKIRFPTRLFLLRGNHEARMMCGACHGYSTLLSESLQLYGAGGGVLPSTGYNIWDKVVECFDYLPYAAVIGRAIFAVHGGLSHSLPTLNQMYLLPRGKSEDLGMIQQEGPENVRGSKKNVNQQQQSFNYRYGADSSVILTPSQELLWNDASRTEEQNDPWLPNNVRRCGFYFNATVVDNFLKQNGLKLIVRGHEVCMDGFDYFAKRKLITLFSAPQYCGMENHGAIMNVGTNLQVTLEMIDGKSLLETPLPPPGTQPVRNRKIAVLKEPSDSIDPKAKVDTMKQLSFDEDQEIGDDLSNDAETEQTGSTGNAIGSQDGDEASNIYTFDVMDEREYISSYDEKKARLVAQAAVKNANGEVDDKAVAELEKLLIAERAPTPPRRAGDHSLPQPTAPTTAAKPSAQQATLFAPDRQAHPQISQPRPTAISTQQSHQTAAQSTPSPRGVVNSSSSNSSLQQSSSGQQLPVARAKGPVKKRSTNNEDSQKGKK